MKDKEKPITFGDSRYFTSPRFISYFILINLLVLFSIFLIEQIIDPSGILFIQVALTISGMYIVSFAFRVKKTLMF